MKFNIVEGDYHITEYKQFVESYNSNKTWKELECSFGKQMAQKLFIKAKENCDVVGRNGCH